MKLLWFAILLFVAAFPAHASRQLPSLAGVSPSLEASLVALMEKVRVLNADLKDEAPRDILDYLRQVALKQHASLNVLAAVGDRTPEHISVVFTVDSYRTALDKICEASELYWWISPQALTIGPRSFYAKEAATPAPPVPEPAP